MHAHSGLRYLILLTALAALAFFVAGVARKQDLGTPGRILGSAFAGLVDLQVLVGLGVLMTRPYIPMYIGHIVMMVLAAVVGHAMLMVNKRRPKPGHALPLVGVAFALLFIVGGIFAIGRSPLQSTVFGG